MSSYLNLPTLEGRREELLMSMFDRHCADDACISSQGHQYKRERWGDKVGLGEGEKGRADMPTSPSL